MQHKHLYAVLALVATLSILWPYSASAQGEWTGNINLFGGQKLLDTDDWKGGGIDLSKPFEYGIKLDFKQKDWPVSIALDYLYANDDDSGLEATITELNLGVRKIWDDFSPAHPFVGVGVSWVDAELEGGGSVDDSAVGGSLNAGVYWRVAEQFNVGLDLMYSFATVDFAGSDVEAGGFHYGVLLGYHW